MTLIELLVVVAILAALATLMLTAGGDMDAQARNDRSAAQGQSILQAVHGPGDAGSRFLADLGRLPHVQSVDPGKVLSELWEPAEDTEWDPDAAYDANDPGAGWPEPWTTLPAEVSLPCGWRGPYLAGSSEELYDGWGREWQVDVDGAGGWREVGTASPPVLHDTLFAVRTLGADHVADTGGESWQNRDHEFHFADGPTTATLTVTLVARDASASPTTFRPVGPDPYPATWQASHAYQVDDTVRSTDRKAAFRCITAGTSNGAEPAWDATIGETTTDGGVEWECVANRLDHNHTHMDRLRVALFAPYTTGSAVTVKRLLARRDVGAAQEETLDVFPAALAGYPHPELAAAWAWEEYHTIRFEGLAPGPRRLFAYGYLDNGGSPAHQLASRVVLVDIKPGSNTLTVYLSEDL
jgi:type II secretory pathway pseudopilin PulG